MPRPLKDPCDRKSTYVRVLMTEFEKKTIQKEASQRSISVGEYMRKAALACKQDLKIE